MDSALRPRDIQTRIRAGESPEEVAEAAQTTVEAIMPFAVPVLAERAHVAQTALTCSVRRRSAEAAHVARTLGDAAQVLFGDVGLGEDDVDWDAWRRDNGQWTLVAQYTVGGRPRRAEFTYDVRGRYVVADNDEARLLTGEAQRRDPGEERPSASSSPDADADRTEHPAARPRLRAVPDQDELPLGDDALELVRERPPAEPAAADSVTEPETATAGPESSPESGPAAAEEPAAPDVADPQPEPRVSPAPAGQGSFFEELFPDTADADWLREEPHPRTEPDATGRPAVEDTDELALDRPETIAPEPGRPRDPDSGPDSGPAAASGEPPAATASEAGADAGTAEPAEPSRKRPTRKKGRASVPSWDEIMFGGGDQGE